MSCRYGVKYTGGISRFTLLYLASFTRPTISMSSLAPLPLSDAMREPTTWPVRLNLRANASLTIATLGPPSMSPRVKSRPPRRRMPTVPK